MIRLINTTKENGSTPPEIGMLSADTFMSGVPRRKVAVQLRERSRLRSSEKTRSRKLHYRIPGDPGFQLAPGSRPMILCADIASMRNI
jgi:hypothetical protein